MKTAKEVVMDVLKKELDFLEDWKLDSTATAIVCELQLENSKFLTIDEIKESNKRSEGIDTDLMQTILHRLKRGETKEEIIASGVDPYAIELVQAIQDKGVQRREKDNEFKNR